MNIKYIVQFDEKEKKTFTELTAKGKQSARMLKRAHLLLMVGQGKSSTEIATVLNVSVVMVMMSEGGIMEKRMLRWYIKADIYMGVIPLGKLAIFSSSVIAGSFFGCLSMPSLINRSFSAEIFSNNTLAGSSSESCGTNNPRTANSKINARSFLTNFAEFSFHNGTFGGRWTTN